jgi:hypothetical protein
LTHVWKSQNLTCNDIYLYVTILSGNGQDGEDGEMGGSMGGGMGGGMQGGKLKSKNYNSFLANFDQNKNKTYGYILICANSRTWWTWR